MKKILYQVYLFVLSIACISLYSCDKDETYDINGDFSNKVYIVNSGMKSFSLLHTLYRSIGEVNLSFELHSTKKAQKDVNVTLQVDNSLIDAYNAAHGTSYAAVPEDAIIFEKESMVIAANSQKAESDVRIHIKNDRLPELTEECYLIPVRIKEVLGDAFFSNTVIYAVIMTTKDFDNLYDGAIPEDVNAAEVMDHSAWTMEVTNTTSVSETIDVLFDNNENTYVYRSSVTNIPCEFIFDLGKVYDLAGIYFDAARRGMSRSGIEAFVSTDGDEWRAINNTQVGYMMFYVPDKIQYLKFYFPPMGSDTRAFFTELKVYTLTE